MGAGVDLPVTLIHTSSTLAIAPVAIPFCLTRGKRLFEEKTSMRVREICGIFT